MSSKRKAPISVASGMLSSEQAGQRGGAPSAASSSKRSRYDGNAAGSDDEDYISGNLDLEEQDRKRNQQGRKGRIVADGYDSEDSDEDEDEDGMDGADQGKGKVAGVDEDDDMFEAQNDPPGVGREGPGGGRAKNKGGKYLELKDIEGQEFATGDQDAMSDEEEQDEERDPELQLEADSDEEGQDEEEDAGAAGEKTPPLSPGGTTVLRSNDKGKGRAEAHHSLDGKKPKTDDPFKDMGYKLDGFNMKKEMASGRFDDEGNYIENAKDPHSEHDTWLQGNYSRKAIRRAKEAQSKREQEVRLREREQEIEEREGGAADGLKKRLAELMEPGESVLEALQRLGAAAKKVRSGTDKKKAGRRESSKPTSTTRDPVATADSEDQDAMDEYAASAAVRSTSASEAATDARLSTATKQAGSGRHPAVKAIEDFTDLTSTLMTKYGLTNIYDDEYESLLRSVRRCGLVPPDWDPAKERQKLLQQSRQELESANFVYRWSPAYLAATADPGAEAEAEAEAGQQTFGPFTGADLNSWKDAGYFGGPTAERIELRRQDAEADQSEGGWSSWVDIFGQ